MYFSDINVAPDELAHGWLDYNLRNQQHGLARDQGVGWIYCNLMYSLIATDAPAAWGVIKIAADNAAAYDPELASTLAMGPFEDLIHKITSGEGTFFSSEGMFYVDIFLPYINICSDELPHLAWLEKRRTRLKTTA